MMDGDTGARARTDFIHFRAVELKADILALVDQVNVEIAQISSNLGHTPKDQETSFGYHSGRKATLSSVSRMLLRHALGQDAAVSEVKESMIVISMATTKAMSRIAHKVGEELPALLDQAYQEVSSGSRGRGASDPA